MKNAKSGNPYTLHKYAVPGNQKVGTKQEYLKQYQQQQLLQLHQQQQLQQ